MSTTHPQFRAGYALLSAILDRAFKGELCAPVPLYPLSFSLQPFRPPLPVTLDFSRLPRLVPLGPLLLFAAALTQGHL